KLREITGEKAAGDARRGDQVVKLEGDLKTALERQRSLEEQLRDAEREQAEKEAAVQALNQELEQAAAALAAEKEGRHAAEEAYADAKDALVEIRKKPRIPSTAIEEIPVENHAIITKGPDLPAIITHGPQALARKEIDRLVPVPPAPADPDTLHAAEEPDEPRVTIRCVEDLFEEPEDLDIDELPDATRVPGAPGGVAGNSVRETGADDSTGASGYKGTATGEYDPDDAEDTCDDDETGDDDAGAADTESVSGEETAGQ